MTPGAPRRHLCSFCGRARAEVGWLFRSGIGGMPAMICDHCVAGLSRTLEVTLPAEIATDHVALNTPAPLRHTRINGHDV